MAYKINNATPCTRVDFLYLKIGNKNNVKPNKSNGIYVYITPSPRNNLPPLAITETDNNNVILRMLLPRTSPITI